MKVILTGATGFIGSATLDALLRHPAVTSVLVLSRRPIPPQIRSPKLVVLILDDFLNYSPAIIQHLAGAEACVWCLGRPRDGKRVHMDLTMAATKAIQEAVPEGNQMTFVYVSGGWVEPDKDKTLFFLSKTRKMRGDVERYVAKLEKQRPEGQWRTIIARPGLVTQEGTLLRFVTGFYIPVKTLGAALADVVAIGSEKQRLENDELKARGEEALTKKK